MKQFTRYTVLSFFAAICLVACESADCTLYNVVSLHANFYSGGQKVALNDTLTITALGTDSVLLNRKTSASELLLPMSYYNEADTYILHVVGETTDIADTITISKTNREHFESPDCASTMFHQITDVRSTHHFIDSISVTRQSVNYDQTENIQIHLFGAD